MRRSLDQRIRTRIVYAAGRGTLRTVCGRHLCLRGSRWVSTLVSTLRSFCARYFPLGGLLSAIRATQMSHASARGVCGVRHPRTTFE